MAVTNPRSEFCSNHLSRVVELPRPASLLNPAKEKMRMERDDNEAVVHSDAINAQPVTSTVGELDLYADLTAFAELSPEEQARSIEPREKASGQASMTPEDHSEETSAQPPILSEEASGAVEPEITDVERETPSSEEAQSAVSFEEQAAELTSEAVKTEESAAEGEFLSTQDTEEYPSPKQSSAYLAIEADHPETRFTEEADQDPSYQPDQTPAPEIPVVLDTTAASESVLCSESPKADVEISGLPPAEAQGPRPSGPLSGFNLPANIVYTGSLSRGVCLSCGAAVLSADDLFCPACGVFIDEIASTAEVDSTCAECKRVISAGEIFCPWCGTALSG